VNTFSDLLIAHDFIVIGHRGAAGLAPENTLQSFALALQWGCPMLELDVYASSYENGVTELIVIHDAKLNRTTSGRGAVSEYSIERLRTLDAGNGQQIPLLSEVVSLVRQHEQTARHPITLNIELKGPDTALPTADFLSAEPKLPVLISSFNHKELQLFREQAANVPVAPLYDRYRSDWHTTATKLGASAVNLSAKIVTSERVRAMQRAGFAVFVYTVNSLEEGLQLKEMGVNGIFTDRPDKLMTLATSQA
jgi:glycerophosphoryl diester phosphodiesterase